MRTSLLAGLFLLSLAFGCGDDDDGGSTPTSVTALRGVVRSAGGSALAGVTVSSGSVTATTDSGGHYQLRVAAGARVVRFEHPMHVVGIERVEVVDGRPTQLDVSLLGLASGMPLDSEAGGMVGAMRGARLMAPADAFVDSSGDAVTGMVTVHLTPLDPSDADELAAAPGDFAAEMGGTRVQLESFGMLDVTVRQGTETLDIAPGKTVAIRIPVPADLDNPPAMERLWSFDEARGLWADEGMAMLDATSNTYEADIEHLSMWNCDRVVEATCICGVVRERGDGPLAGAAVEASGLDYFGSSSTTTDMDGRFCLAVRKDSRVTVAAYHASGGGTTREAMSGSADTMVPPPVGSAGCFDIGTIEVERDRFEYPDGTATDCGDVMNPFAASCASDLWQVFSCYEPTGSCNRMTGAAGSSTTTYANGSRMVTTVAATGVMTMYFGPDGQMCGSSSVAIMSGSATTIEYHTPSGDTFQMRFPDDDSGDLIIVCADGTEVVVTPAQRQAVEACNVDMGSMSMPQMCTSTGPGPGSNCTTDADCTEGDNTTCCDFSGTKFCAAPDSCAGAQMCAGVMCTAPAFCNPMTGMCASVCDFVMCPSGQTCNAMSGACE